MTQEELLNLKDGTRVVVIETGDNWDRDKIPVVCVKVCDRLIEADLQPFDHIKRNYLPYYNIKEMYDKGYEIEVFLEENSLSLKEQISELEDVCASAFAQHEAFVDEVCEIIFTSEPTEILDRIREFVGYNEWLLKEAE